MEHGFPGRSVVLFVHVVPDANPKFPVMVSPVSERFVVPEFVSVTSLEVLVVPVFWVPKLRLVALSVAFGLITVADIGIVCGLPEALSAITRLAACVFVTLESAVKLMMIVQVLPALSVLGQNAMPR